MTFTKQVLLAREGKGGGGVSLEPEDAISVGIFGPGEAKVVESIFADYNYGGKSKAVPVWLITYERDGEKYEQPYSVGNGWRVSSDGESLIPKNGQTGLPDSCNAMLLLQSLRKAGFPKGKLGANPRILEGMEVILVREAQPDRGLDGPPKKDAPTKQPKTILLVDSIETLPWDADEKPAKGKAKAKAKADDEEDDDDEPVKKKKKPAADDDDEDEAPAKAKAKGKGKDDDDTDDEDIVEAAGEAIIEVCEKAGEAVDVDDLESLVLKLLKGNKDREAIAEKAVEIVGNENGWTFNKKKNTVESDE